MARKVKEFAISRSSGEGVENSKVVGKWHSPIEKAASALSGRQTAHLARLLSYSHARARFFDGRGG